MTRGEAQVARAIEAYSDLPARIRRATALFRGCVAGFVLLALLGATAAGSATRWTAAAPVWLWLAAVFLVVAIVARLNVTTLERRQADEAETARVAALREEARRMRAASFEPNRAGALATMGRARGEATVRRPAFVGEAASEAGRAA